MAAVSVSPASRICWPELALLFLASRSLIALIGWLTPLIVRPGAFARGDIHFSTAWLRWDATFYHAIATTGYSYEPGQMSSVAFFPLYPLLIHLLGWLINPVVAGYLVSNAALFCAAVLLWKITELEAQSAGSRWMAGDGMLAVALLLFGPVSFFHSIIYSEALFLALVLATLYAGRLGRWRLAGLAGLAAALTRNAGVLLVVPLLLEYFEASWRAPFFRRDPQWWRAWPCLLPIAGLMIWAGYLQWKFGDATIFLKVQDAWDRQLTWPWVAFRPDRLWNFPVFHQYWFVGHAICALLLLAAGFLARLRPSLAIVSALMLLLNISANHLEAIPRLLSVIAPLYLCGALVLRRAPGGPLAGVAFSAALLALSTTLFVNGYWFT